MKLTLRGVIATLGLLSTGLAHAQRYTIVDVQKVPAIGDYRAAIIEVRVPPDVREITCDVLVAGGGVGGVAAAMRAAQRGNTVCLTEETDVLGGQLHSTPALDEHKFIEVSGAVRSYHEFRNRVREHYRKNTRLTAAAMEWENLNPGACYVSSLCFEPKVGAGVLRDMLGPNMSRIQLLMRTKVVDAAVSGSRVVSATAWQFDKQEAIRIRPRFVLDATETGELLPLVKTPHVVGSEAASDTGEPHAAGKANPNCVQSFTYTFAVEHRPGSDGRVPKPPDYERIRDSQPFSLRMNYPREYGWKGSFQYSVFGEDAPVPNNMSPRPFFPWRRLLAKKNFEGPDAPNDLALMNWPRQDYHSESLLARTPLDTARVLQAAKQVALSFLYWMQHDIPRDDGQGSGYRDFVLRKDVMGSEDGLSKYPYIRESLRLSAMGRVTEGDLNIDHPTSARARSFPDSVGTGFYMVDIHPCGANEKGRMMMPKPFQIPMSTLIPQDLKNFLAAGKNLGVTHLTNGAFRLHPLEWNIGESAAVIASMSLAASALPKPADVQRELVQAGIPLFWFDDVPVTHPAFAAIQLAAIRGWYPVDDRNLHASPDSPITRNEAARVLSAFFDQPLATDAAVERALQAGWMTVDHRNWFHGDLPFYWTDWREGKLPRPLPVFQIKRTGPVTRAELARRLTGL